MTSARLLIVNADDFGLSSAVNEGVIRAHEEGIVTSATLMVRCPAAAAAADYARRRGSLSVGLHVDLGEWRYTEGAWRPVYEVVPHHDRAAVAAEIDRQIDRFRELLGRDPSHLDSHQHVHRHEPVRSLLRRAGDRLKVPVRDLTPGLRYLGDFYGQDGRGVPLPDSITVDALVALIEDLPAGATELGCHPGLDDGLDTQYVYERAHEVEALCAGEVREAVARSGVILASFIDIRGIWGA